MKQSTLSKLLAFSLFFMAMWFFGNLYEEIVLTPNQLVNTYEKLQHWHQFFTVSNPIFFYVPFTLLAPVVLCVLYFKISDPAMKNLLKWASIFSVVGTLVSVAIITQINVKIFFGDIDKYRDQLYDLTVIWLIGNAIRICFVGVSLYYTLRAYVLCQVKKS